MWTDSRRRVGIAVATLIVFGLATAWWMPRGPMSSGQALATMVISAAVGGAVGLVMRSRWAMLLAPTVFVVVFEVARIGTDSTTVDGIHPGSTYGLIAFVVGRGFHGVASLVPMALGAAFGAALARRIIAEPVPPGSRAGAGRWARRTGAGLVGLGLAVLLIGLVRPTGTASIRDADGEPITGSVADLIRIDIGGHNLAMTIRGDSVDNPVLLYLAGGPGGSDIGAMRKYLEGLEQHFVVVTLDQRGSGKSYDQLDPISTLTFDNAVDDAVEVTEYLGDRFGNGSGVYLVGNSYGTLVGVRAVQQAPALYAAFVGTGQMVSVRETDQIIYADTLAWARRKGNDSVVDILTASGPPPYTRILDYEPALSHLDEVYPYDHEPNAEGAGGFSENLVAAEYSLVDEVHLLAGFLDTFSIVYPQLQDIDLRVDADQIDVPVYIVEGGHEARGRTEPAHEWFDMLEAPRKEMVVFDAAGHRPLFEQPELFIEFMTGAVLADTTTLAASLGGSGSSTGRR